MATLRAALGGKIPDWYVSLLSKLPISGIEVGWQAFPPEEDFDGIEWLEILDAPLIKEINLDGYPGQILFELGYFCFGYGSTWAGNCFAVNCQEEDPAVYEVWHDAARDKQKMEKAIEELSGVKMVARSFSEFFNGAVPPKLGAQLGISDQAVDPDSSTFNINL